MRKFKMFNLVALYFINFFCFRACRNFALMICTLINNYNRPLRLKNIPENGCSQRRRARCPLLILKGDTFRERASFPLVSAPAERRGRWGKASGPAAGRGNALGGPAGAPGPALGAARSAPGCPQLLGTANRQGCGGQVRGPFNALQGPMRGFGCFLVVNNAENE